MSEEIILTNAGAPFATEKAAKRMRTEKAKEGVDTKITPVTGGFALLVKEQVEPELPEDDLEERREHRRPKRVPLHTRNKLFISKKDKDPNYVYRVINDKDNRIQEAKDAGYEIVYKKDLKTADPDLNRPNQLGEAVTIPAGSGDVAYLMRIKREWYDEDQRAKTARIKETENQLKRQPEKPGQYGEIKVSR